MKAEYIKHCLNYYPEKPNSYNGKTIISVGRFEKEKGFLDLIDVFNELVKLDKKYKLILVGSGSQEEEIKNKISKYKLNKNVTLTGFLNKEKVNKEFSKASIYLMTSTSEAFGLVLIEAMAFGIPCLSFDSAAGAKEIINNKNGLILNGRDNNEMVKKTEEIFSNRTLYDTMSKEARKTSEKYKLEVIQKDWLSFIERI